MLKNNQLETSGKTISFSCAVKQKTLHIPISLGNQIKIINPDGSVEVYDMDGGSLIVDDGAIISVPLKSLPEQSKQSGFIEGVEAAFPRCRSVCGDLADGLDEFGDDIRGMNGD